MMNVLQLSENIDSLKRAKKKSVTTMNSTMSPYVTLSNKGKETDQITKGIKAFAGRPHKYDSSFLETIPDSLRTSVLHTAAANVRNFKSLVEVNNINRKFDDENYIKYATEWHRKFTLSFACILLFLIGAPLGAIIRKGGLGMPLVIAVIFFMAFHILNITGEKLVKAGSAIPWVGMWMSTAILLPLAIWLIKSARNDSQILTKEWYVRVWRKIKIILPVKNKTVA